MSFHRLPLVALCAASTALPGCVARPVPPSPQNVAPLAAPTAPEPSALPAEAVAIPGLYKAYYVGQIIDPAHPELMYRPGVVYRQESAERWNRNPAATAGAVSGVIGAVTDPARLAPFSAEQQQLIAQQREALALLADDNARLTASSAATTPNADTPDTTPAVHESPTPATTPTVDLAVDPLPIAPPAPPADAEPIAAAKAYDFNRALIPNSDGIIVLSPELLEQIDRNEPNPFVRRHQLATQFRDITLALTGTAPGPRSSCTVNGRIYNNGDSLEGFRVVGIARDAVYLERGPFLLQIPLARERPVVVRIPN